jgi:hypothetical protein
VAIDKDGAVSGAYLNVMFYLLVVGVGVSVALQQVPNANLRMELGSPWWAGFISYFIGTVMMLAVAITSGGPRLSGAMADHGVDLGAQPAARAPDRLVLAIFFGAPALC